MDRQQIELFVSLGSAILFLLGVVLAWFTLPWLSREQLLFAGAIVIVIVFVLSFRLSIFLEQYVIAPRELADDLAIMINANPNHRVTVKGPKNMRHLAETINLLADRIQGVLDNQAATIKQAQQNLEEEKDRLATLMSELTEGVLVCNSEGRILLYNHRAKRLLEQETTSNNGPSSAPINGGFVGLGRSLFGLIDRNVITHALEDLARRYENQRAKQFTQFVTAAANGHFIRARVAPILTSPQRNLLDTMNGFILTLEDVTQQSRRSMRRDSLLRTLIEGVRASLANIRSAIEMIEDYPDMDAQQLGQLRHVIYDEALAMSSHLNQTTAEYEADLKANWQLEEMLVSDLLWAIQQRLEDKLEVDVTLATHDVNLWVKVDSYAVVRALAFIMGRLKTDFGILAATLRATQTGQLMALDLVWDSDRVDLDDLWTWQNEAITQMGDHALSLSEIIERHGGEVWCQTDKETKQAYLRLLLPISPAKPILTTQKGVKTASPKISSLPSRPEYYDFDLFRQSIASELDQRNLTELTYTVFDTETTGLNPSAGDEIVSISAVRIVNNRLLRHEVFDQLVDPRRSLPPEATAVHGISPEMVQGQPTIDTVLPSFHRFAEGTVLVAHNAAFDMRLFQLKEQQTGIKFVNPVVDTLLLSAVIHPHQKDHGLEAIAERLGVNIIGRHTSLGDSIVTGEVLLKMIPLLAEKGIYTLAEAREVAQKTYQARIKY